VEYVPGTTSVLIIKKNIQINQSDLRCLHMSSLGLKPGLGASTSVLFIYHLSLILGITYSSSFRGI